MLIMVHGCVSDWGQLEQRIVFFFSGVATLQPTVMSLCSCVWGKIHIVCGVERSIQSVTEAKEKGWGASPWRLPTILNCRRMMAKQSLFSPANTVRLQVLKMACHKTNISERFELNCNYLLERRWNFHCTQTCRIDTIGQCNPLDPMLKVFL